MSHDGFRDAVGRPFDVTVVGGGCVGSAVAMYAARAGLRVALVERDDFSAGATWASTELIHGGLQYLFRARLGIVRKSNEYAQHIYRSANYLCEPVGIIVPCYRGGPIPMSALRAVMWVYDRYNRRYKGAPGAERLTAAEIFEAVPALASEGLLGGIRYYEWRIDASRLCLMNAMAAEEAGATIRNHAGVVAVTRDEGGTVSVTVDDQRTGERLTLATRTIVNATGPWTDRFCALAGIGGGARIRPTRGAHVFLRKVSDAGVLIPFVDGRFGVMVPRGHLSMVGTTDDDYYGDLDALSATEDEVGYLMEGIRRYLPGVSPEDVVDTKVGVRPTIHQFGMNEDKVSRDHRIECHDGDGFPEIVSVFGGKLATHTLMAEEVVARVGTILKRELKHAVEARLPGATQEDFESYSRRAVADAVNAHGVTDNVARALVKRYGTHHEQVMKLVADDPTWGRNLCRCSGAAPVIAAEVAYAVESEYAVTAADVQRRTGLGLGTCKENGCLESARDLLKELGCQEIASAGGRAGDATPRR